MNPIRAWRRKRRVQRTLQLVDDYNTYRTAFYYDNAGVLRDYLGRARPDVEDTIEAIGLEREGWDIPPAA